MLSHFAAHWWFYIFRACAEMWIGTYITPEKCKRYSVLTWLLGLYNCRWTEFKFESSQLKLRIVRPSMLQCGAVYCWPVNKHMTINRLINIPCAVMLLVHSYIHRSRSVVLPLSTLWFVKFDASFYCNRAASLFLFCQHHGPSTTLRLPGRIPRGQNALSQNPLGQNPLWTKSP